MNIGRSSSAKQIRRFFRFPRSASIAFIISFFIATPSLAHHSFTALYDYDVSVTLLGNVSKIDYINPHIFFNVDVTEDGELVTYRIETMQANLARSYDFHADTMAVGDPVEVTGWVGHTNPTALGGQELVLKDGTVFLLRTDGASPGNPRNRDMFGFIGEVRTPSPAERMAAAE